MNKKLLLSSVAVAAATTISTQAALVTWGGAGSSGSPEYWNLAGTGAGQNGDSTHWNQATPPVTDGTDDVVMSGGGLKKDSGITWANGSDFTMNSGAYFRYNAGNMVVSSTVALNDSSTIQLSAGGLFVSNSATGDVTVNTGSEVRIATGYFNTTGGTINIAGGTILSSGAQSNPIRATTGLDSGGFNFTEIGGTIQIDTFTDTDLLTYLDGKRGTGFFKIDGTAVTGFGDTHKVGNEWIEFSGTAGAGTLTLITIPEPSSTALLGLGGLALILRRRSKLWRDRCAAGNNPDFHQYTFKHPLDSFPVGVFCTETK